MIEEIKHGDKIKCLNCREPILINTETFKFDSFGEYIKCPKCNKTYPIDIYYARGEKVFNAKQKYRDICEKCGKEAKHIHMSTSHKTLKLCEKCEIEYNSYIRQKANEFLGKEFF